MMVQRDTLYEKELQKNVQLVTTVLEKYSTKPSTEWVFTDTLACQRAIQVAIEAMIGLARYCVELLYQIRVSKSREAIDELYRLNEITQVEHGNIIKMIGFRNVLVHDYLKLEDAVVDAIIRDKKYQDISSFMAKLFEKLDRL